MDFTRVDGVDIDIQIVFRGIHLKLLMPYFKQAGLSSDVINASIDEYISTGEIVPFEKWFLQTGQRKLNPLMNKFLKRDPAHPTFNNILRVALKSEIESNETILNLKKFKAKLSIL